jgi:ribosomal protein S18 acetylase RimI-like enzyme
MKITLQTDCPNYLAHVALKHNLYVKKHGKNGLGGALECALMDGCSENSIVVAYHGKKPVGCAQLYKDFGCVFLNVYVHIEYRQNGIGRMMVDELKKINSNIPTKKWKYYTHAKIPETFYSKTI